MSNESNKAFYIANIIEQAKSDSYTNFLTIGKALDMVAKEKLFLEYASHTTSMNKFLQEIGVTRSWAYNSMRVYRAFGHLDLKGIRYDRMVRLLQLRLENDSEKEAWLNAAKVLPAKGFVDEVREAMGLTPSDKCEHKEYSVLHRCKKCHSIIKGE
jgi:hypothetical protein